MSFEQIEVELLETMGSDFSIASSAWTSSTTQNGKLKKTKEQAEDLVRRLVKDGHSVPFESVVMRFWIRMPIYIDRQFVTHRIASHNGMSGRYRTMPTDFYKLPDDVKGILSKINNPFIDYCDIYEQMCTESMDWYQSSLTALKLGETEGRLTNTEYKRAREVLRGMCPLAGMTERTTTFNLRSLANFISMRMSEHAQLEICDVAVKMLDELKFHNVCPIALEALEERGWKI